MEEDKLNKVISVFFILRHFLIIILIVGFRMLGWYGKEDFQVSLPIIAPIFASFSTLIVLYIIENKNNTEKQDKMVSSMFVFISFFIPIVFLLFILLVLIKQAVTPVSIEDFSTYLGISESVFGIYIGYILKSLFKRENKPNNE